MDPKVFDSTECVRLNPDLRGYGAVDAQIHWLRHGVTEGRIGSCRLSPQRYLALYSDLARVWGLSNYQKAIEHYVTAGYREGRRAPPPACR